MACREITIDGKTFTSKTWNAIRDLTDSDEQADVLYSQLAHPQFLTWFGNWIEPRKSVIVVRHAITPEDIAGKNSGQNDISITDEGRKKMEGEGEKLKAQGITNLYISPSKRTVESAKATGIPYIVVDGLNAWDIGKYSGKPEGQFDEAYYVKNSSEKPEGGESFNDFVKHTMDALNNVYGADATNAILTHSKTIKLIEALEQTNGEYNEKTKQLYLKDSSIGNDQSKSFDIYDQNISKVRTEDGEPLVVYHGSPKEFSEFKKLSELYNNPQLWHSGFHFGTKEAAEGRLRGLESYMRNISLELEDEEQMGKNIYPVFLNIQNPLRVEDDKSINWARRDIIASENDGLVYSNRVEDKGRDSYVTFNSNQIKSVFNQGTFSPETGNIYQQKEGIAQTKASPKTVEKIKEFLRRIGVEWKDVNSIVVNGIKYDANGVADIFNNLIQIVDGKENVALAEEAMHFGTAIIKQTNPVLYKQMMNKISSYSIYNQVREQYRNDKAYQNADGTPNIIKLKEEAIGKVLAETYIQNAEGKIESNLLEQSKTWLQHIIDWFKNLIGKAGFNPFKEALTELERVTGEQAQAALQGEEGVFSQLSPPDKRETDLDKKLEDFNVQKIVEKPSGKEDEEASNYYTANIEGKEVKPERATEVAKRKNKERYGKDYFESATPEMKEQWAKKAMSGLNVHADVEDMINSSVKEDRTLKPVSEISMDFKPRTHPKIFDILKKFLIGTTINPGFLYTYPTGTKFRVEQIVFNEKSGKNGEAGTIDLLALMPDGKEEIVDWKLMGFSLDKNRDIPFQKRTQHAIQLGEYKKIRSQAYGIKPLNITAKTIPIHGVYKMKREGAKMVPVLDSITIGKVNIRDEERTYLLPVVPEGQTSGNPEIDSLVNALNARWAKLYKKPVEEGKRYLKDEALGLLSEAIRNLQVAQNFEPISREALNFQASVGKLIQKYKEQDPSKLSDKDMDEAFDELLGIYKAADVYSNLDEIFISEYGTENLDVKHRKVLDSLKLSSSTAKEKKDDILSFIKQYIGEVANRNNISNILSPSKEMKGIINSFSEVSDLLPQQFKLYAKVITEARSHDKIMSNKQIDEFGKLLIAANKTTGGNAYNIIAKKNENELIDKTDPEFWRRLYKAKEEQNKKFILESINVDRYNELAQAKINERKEQIENTIYSTDDRENTKIRNKRINDIKKALDISRADFNGYTDNVFSSLVNKTVKEDEHYTEEYKALLNNKPASDLYIFLENLNRRAYATSYLSHGQSLRFLPFTKNTILQRLIQGNAIEAIGTSIKDAYTVLANESAAYGRKTDIDPETGKRLKTIPKPFTVDQGDNSKDLAKIVPLYIIALNEYETSSALESTLNALHTVMENIGHYETEKGSGYVLMENELPKIFQGNKTNAEILQSYIDDSIYGIKLETESAIDTAIDRFTKGTEEQKEERKLSIKKGIQSTNKYTQVLAVGMKPLIAGSNYIGAHLQSIINAGPFFKYSEYFANHIQVISSAFTPGEGNVLKALIHSISPLNEDIAKEKSREIAYKTGIGNWISQWSFFDILMSSNRIPDKSHELANASSWIKNTIIRDGKLVNARQWLANEDRSTKYIQSGDEQKDYTERRALEKSFEKRLQELKDTESLPKISKFNEKGELEIPGVDITSKDFAAYRNRIVEYGRKITAQMSTDNKAQYRRKIIMNSFMMFKNWIVKQVSLRAFDIHKNELLDNWEYGRTRLFLKVWNHLGLRNIWKMKQLISGTPEGLKIMSEILEEKKQEYFKKTGQELEISPEEFYDMTRREIVNESKELLLLFALGLMVIGAKFGLQPDPDEDDLSKNRMKTLAKQINKISDELLFYYDPTSMASITRGTVLPSLGILTQAGSLMSNFSSYMLGEITDNQKLIDKNHPIKYFVNMIPIAAQFQNEILPSIDPEAAKALGVKVSPQSRAFGH